MTDKPTSGQASRVGAGESRLGRLARARPTKPGEIYGVPGQGSTLWLSAVSILLFLFVWWLVTAMGWVKPLFVPSPMTIVTKLISVWNVGFTGTPFLVHVEISTVRVFSAFLLACVVGIPLGLAMGMSPLMRGLFDPPIEFYRPIPPLAYLPLMIIWFGIGETSKILLIFLSVFAPVVLGARSGVKSASIEQIHAAYSFGATRWQVLMRVILPSAMPEILTAMRIGIGFGWTTLVAAELVGAVAGLGQILNQAAQDIYPAMIVVGMASVAVCGWLMTLGLPNPLAGMPAPVPQAAIGLFLLAETVNLAAAMIACRAPQHRHLRRWVPALWLYFPLASLAALKALWDLAGRPFHWDKTPHGLCDDLSGA